MQDQVRDKSA